MNNIHYRISGFLENIHKFTDMIFGSICIFKLSCAKFLAGCLIDRQ